MPTLEFKGKAHLHAHHMTAPYRPLAPDRYATGFAVRRADLESDMPDVAGRVASDLAGKRLHRHDPVADNGPASGARA